MSPTTTGAKALPMRITTGDAGVTSSCSKVPSSRSRATDSPDRSTTWMKHMIPKIPGLKNQRVSWLGLNQVRTWRLIGGSRPACSSIHSLMIRLV